MRGGMIWNMENVKKSEGGCPQMTVYALYTFNIFVSSNGIALMCGVKPYGCRMIGFRWL